MTNSIEFERAVIGAILTDASVIDEVAAIIEPSHFYLISLGKTYELMLQLRADGKAIDLITVDRELRAHKTDQPTASELTAWAYTALPSSAATYAKAVKTEATRRAMTTAFQDGLAKLNADGENPQTVGEDLAAKILQLCGEQRRQFVSIDEATLSVLKSIERSATELRDAVPTGLSSIDRKLGGLFRGQLIIIAGRPSMGKTAMAMTIAKGAAQRNYATAVVSCESPTNSIVMRLISAASGVENIRLRAGKLVDQDYPKITLAAGQISGLPIFLHDRERNWEPIKAALRSFKIKHPELALVVVDYAQLLRIRSREDRWQQMGQISAESKELALELDVPFILLSQISRAVEQRQNKRPTMADLRESGNLEQDADVIGLLYRAHYYDKSESPDEAQIDIAKNRDGAAGVIEIIFDEKTASFYDPPDASADQPAQRSMFGDNGHA